jgi:hypothetical protein
LVGSDVSHVTGRCPVRKYVLRMPGFCPRFFFSSSNMATECDRRSLDPFGVLLGVRNRKLCNTRSSSKQCWLGCSLRRPRPITIVNPRPIFSMVTGTSLCYLPLLFSYSVYIGCVVLQGCLRSHCGISMSQMVNLIPSCIVSSQKTISG